MLNSDNRQMLMAIKVHTKTIGLELVEVKSVSHPICNVNYIDYVYDDIYTKRKKKQDERINKISKIRTRIKKEDN